MSFKILSTEELRLRWSKVWGIKAHPRIGRIMLEESLSFKLHENISTEQRKHLNKLVRQYKRNTGCFDNRVNVLKPGTRLVKTYQGKLHTILVRSDGFEYQGQAYKSLSSIANYITGKRWNGWVFFGLKKAGRS